MHIQAHEQTRTPMHTSPSKRGSWAQTSAGGWESSVAGYSHTHQDGFAVFIFNHWVSVWEPIETTELKLPGSNCWTKFRKG